MTTTQSLGEVWACAEKLFANVHLHKVSDGYYLAQVNRRPCICSLCSCDGVGATPIEALLSAMQTLADRPLHEPQGPVSRDGHDTAERSKP